MDSNVYVGMPGKKQNGGAVDSTPDKTGYITQMPIEILELITSFLGSNDAHHLIDAFELTKLEDEVKLIAYKQIQTVCTANHTTLLNKSLRLG